MASESKFRDVRGMTIEEIRALDRERMAAQNDNVFYNCMSCGQVRFARVDYREPDYRDFCCTCRKETVWRLKEVKL